VETQRQALHLRQVAAALFRRYGLAHFVEVPEHLGLAMGAQRADLGELLFGLRRQAVAGGERLLEFLLSGRDALAHLAAPGEIAFMQLADALEFALAELELAAEPREIVARRNQMLRAKASGEGARQPDDGRARQSDGQQDEEGDTVVMSCPKCKDTWVTVVENTGKAANPQEAKAVQRHACPGCETKLVTEGAGKPAKNVVKHVCKQCGSKDAFCCVLKKGSGPTQGMAAPAEHQH